MEVKTFLLSVSLLIAPALLSAQNIAYEGFDSSVYTSGDGLSGESGGSGWTDSWSDSITDGVIGDSTSLTYLDLQTTNGSAVKDSATSYGTFKRHFRENSSYNGALYFSILIQNGIGNHPNADSFFVLDQDAFGQQRYHIRNNGSGQIMLGINMVSGGTETIGVTTGLNLDQTVLIVGELIVGSANDKITLYFNPTDLTDVAGTADETITGLESDFTGSFQTTINQYGFTSTSRANRIDEIRISHGAGASIADVVPQVPLIYEGFDNTTYTASASINTGNGGEDWTDTWADDGDDFQTQTDGLSYLNLQTTDGGVQKDATAGFGRMSRHFRENSAFTGSIYFSALVQSPSNHPNDALLLLDENTFGQQRYRIINNGTGQLSVQVKLAGGSGSHETLGTTTSLDLSQPVLIVGELSLGTNSDTLSVYFNPTNLNDVPDTASETITGAETSFNGVFKTEINHFAAVSTGRSNQVDEIRLTYGPGSALEDVIPFDPIPGATPNILFICIDDLMPLLGTYGEPQMHTPRMDTLASQGLQFNNAYVNQAICAPSRINLMTGLRPLTTNIYDIVTDFRDTVPWAITLPELLRSYGYHSTSRGKVFHGVSSDNYDASNPTQRYSWNLDDPSSGYDSRDYVDAVSQAAARADQPPYEIGVDGLGASVADDAYVEGQLANDAVAKLDELKWKQPFFFAVGFHRPHLPFNAPKAYWDLYDTATIDAALPTRNTPADNAPVYAYTNSGELRNYGNVPQGGTEIYTDTTLFRNLVHGYHACVSYIDTLVGQVLDGLTAAGLDDNTIVVLWSDHGYNLGYQNQWNKHTNAETATRIPFIIRAPGITPDTETDAFIETVDIYPTLLDMLGFAQPEWLEGTSFKNVIDNPATATIRNSAFSQYPRYTFQTAQDGTLYPLDVMGYSIITDTGYRYTEWRREFSTDAVARELYIHATDPNEDTNVVDDPANAAIVATLAAELEARIEAEKPTSNGAAVDLVLNGGFDDGVEGLDPWTAGAHSGAVATFTQVNGHSAPGEEPAMQVDVTTLGPNNSSINFNQVVPIQEDRFYTIRFKAKASAERKIRVLWNGSGGIYGPDFANGANGTSQMIIGTDLATYEFTAITPRNLSGTDNAAKLQFRFGDELGTVWIDSIEVLQQSSFMRELDKAGLSIYTTDLSADTDNDSVSLLEEYASNLSFSSPDFEILEPASGTSGLPTGNLTAADATGRLRMKYIRRRDAADLSYHVEFSDDLGQTDPWTGSPNAEVVTPIDNNWEKVAVDDSKDTVNTGERFGRVRIEYND